LLVHLPSQSRITNSEFVMFAPNPGLHHSWCPRHYIVRGERARPRLTQLDLRLSTKLRSVQIGSFSHIICTPAKQSTNHNHEANMCSFVRAITISIVVRTPIYFPCKYKAFKLGLRQDLIKFCCRSRLLGTSTPYGTKTIKHLVSHTPNTPADTHCFNLAPIHFPHLPFNYGCDRKQLRFRCIQPVTGPVSAKTIWS